MSETAGRNDDSGRAEAVRDDHPEGSSAEDPAPHDRDAAELSHGQAEAILGRALDTRSALDDALGDLIADARSDPGRLDPDRLDALDAAVDQAVELRGDLSELRAELTDSTNDTDTEDNHD